MSGFTVGKSDLELDLLADERTEERGGARSVAALEEPAFGAAAAAARSLSGETSFWKASCSSHWA